MASILILGSWSSTQAYGLVIDDFENGGVQFSFPNPSNEDSIIESVSSGVIGGTRDIFMSTGVGSAPSFSINTVPTQGKLSFNGDFGGETEVSTIYDANGNSLNLDLTNEEGIRILVNDVTTDVVIRILLDSGIRNSSPS